MITLALGAAEALIVGLHIATAHVASATASDMHAFNPGVYVRTPAGLTGGLYRNSEGRTSAYAGWTWTTDDGRWALTAGAVTGYDHARLSALVVPSVRIDAGDGWSVRLAGLPKPHSNGAAGIHLAIERAW